MAIISIPKPLREKLGDEGTEALVQVLNENEKEFRSSVIEFAEQRFEQSLSREIAGVRVELADAEKRFEQSLSREIAGVRVELADAEKRLEKHLTEEITGVRVELAETDKSLRTEISGLREEMVRSDLSVRDELKADIADLRGRVEKSKSDTIKWMFLFWVGQIGAVLGIILAVFK
jgi:hypothetical protein